MFFHHLPCSAALLARFALQQRIGVDKQDGPEKSVSYIHLPRGPSWSQMHGSGSGKQSTAAVSQRNLSMWKRGAPIVMLAASPEGTLC